MKYIFQAQILKNFLPLQKAVRLVGVAVSDVKPYDKQQLLFEDMEKQNKLSQAIDEINKKYGAFTIKNASVMFSENFGIRPACGMLSKHLLK